MNDEFICSKPPGICSQEDFDHDWKLLMKKVHPDDRFNLVGLLVMSKECGYKIEEMDVWPNSLE